MIRTGTYARYRYKEYKAKIVDNGILLISREQEKGFEFSNGKYIKLVQPTDIHDVYNLSIRAVYKRHVCLVDKINNENIELWYIGAKKIDRALGFNFPNTPRPKKWVSSKEVNGVLLIKSAIGKLPFKSRRVTKITNIRTLERYC